MIWLTPVVASAAWFFMALWVEGQTSVAWLALLAGSVLICTIRTKRKFKIFAVLLLVVLAVLLPLRSSALIQINNPPQLQPYLWKSHTVLLELESKQNAGLAVARVIQPTDLLGTRVLVSKPPSLLEAGCRLSGEYRFVPFRSKELSWILKPTDETSHTCSTESSIAKLRSQYRHAIHATSADAGALVLGLAIGDDSQLSPAVREQMRQLSLTHLTAVSGANCAIVIGLVILILRRVRVARVLRVLISLLVLFLYVLIVGPEPSVLRAATMTAVLLICLLGGRPLRPVVSLSLAVLVLLLAYPFFANDLGFALSIAATFGLLTLTPHIYRKLKLRLPRPIAASISVAAAAQVWCLPILLELQGGLPTYSLIANALAEPLVAPITVLGLLALIFTPLFPPVAGFLSWFASFTAEGILICSRTISGMPLLTLWWPPGWQGVVILILIALSVSLFAIQKRKIASFLSALCLAWFSATSATSAAQFASWPLPSWSLVNCDVGQGDALVIRSGKSVALVDVGKEDKLIDECLARLGVSQIDLLVLTHFDMDHVGGLTGALHNRSVSQALVTDFADDRSQARWFESELLAVTNVTRASAGLQGRLGETSWLVLQPEHSGLGSEDSNDGSIAMRWDDSQFVLFTMADLGERGQMRLVEKHPGWIRVNDSRPVILKVSHHGSADQYSELIESWHPSVALISVGEQNPYGHPTRSLLQTLHRAQSKILRTDLNGALSLGFGTNRDTYVVTQD